MNTRSPGNSWMGWSLMALTACFATSVVAANSWRLSSPGGNCRISVSLVTQGSLSYQVFYKGKPVILNSPLGLRRADQAFDQGLKLESAGAIEHHREVYELLAGVRPRVDRLVNHRSLVFRNPSGAKVVLELAASDEGVAFRYRFPDHVPSIHIVKDELTGFTVPADARGWLQPYHSASQYTPAYEDFFFNVAPGEPPPDSRAKAVGWCFPGLFEVRSAGAWALITESDTGAEYCGCHLAPESTGGTYRIAFPLADEHTRGQTNRVSPEPRSSLPWTMPWRVVVLGRTAGDIAMATLVGLSGRTEYHGIV